MKNNQKEVIGMDTTREWFVEPEGDRTFTIETVDKTVYDLWFIHGTIVTA